MNLVSKVPFTLLLAALLRSPPAYAQLVPDGGTLTINNTTTNLSVGLTIGTNGGNTSLFLENQGKVFSLAGTIGLNAPSSGNEVRGQRGGFALGQ